MEQAKFNINDFYQKVEENGFYTKANRLKFYLEKYLFKGLDFQGKKMIDIGGGNGLFAFYAAINGAEKVVVMEPEFDGSTEGIQKQFEQLRKLFGDIQNIEFSKDTLQDYETSVKFDVILLHNSINHLDEENCERLHFDLKAQEQYSEVLELLTGICNPGAELIISDCSRKNFFPKFGLSNPFVKSIEWQKHQTPQIWVNILGKLGFMKKSLSWSSYNSFKSLGRFFLGNKVAAYFLYSHFMLKFEYRPK